MATFSHNLKKSPLTLGCLKLLSLTADHRLPPSCPSSGVMGDREKIAFGCARTPPSIFHQFLSNVEEYITEIRGVI